VILSTLVTRAPRFDAWLAWGLLRAGLGGKFADRGVGPAGMPLGSARLRRHRPGALVRAPCASVAYVTNVSRSARGAPRIACGEEMGQEVA
jgi:hypothetical protein